MWSTAMAGSHRVFRRPSPPSFSGRPVRGWQDSMGTVALAPPEYTIRPPDRHHLSPALPACRKAGERKWGLLLPGAPEPRLTLLRRQGFRSVFQTAYAA